MNFLTLAAAVLAMMLCVMLWREATLYVMIVAAFVIGFIERRQIIERRRDRH